MKAVIKFYFVMALIFALVRYIDILLVLHEKPGGIAFFLGPIVTSLIWPLYFGAVVVEFDWRLALELIASIALTYLVTQLGRKAEP